MIEKRLEGSMSECTANNSDQLSEIDDITCKSIDIRNHWKTYFEKNYTPQENCTDTKFDNEVNNIVASEIVCIKNNLPNVNIECFTPKEVETVCKSLNLNKARGADGIYAKHLKLQVSVSS